MTSPSSPPPGTPPPAAPPPRRGPPKAMLIGLITALVGAAVAGAFVLGRRTAET